MEHTEERIDAKLDLDKIISSRRTTDMQAAYLTLAAMGYTDVEVCRHFEWSHNRCQIIKQEIRERFA